MTFKRCHGVLIALSVTLAPHAALAQDPLVGRSGLSYLLAFGPKQEPVLTLLLALIALMLAVILVIAVLVVAGAFWRRAPASNPAAVSPQRPSTGLSFIYIGCAVTIPLLVGIAGWTYAVLADVSWPPQTEKAPFTIEVTAHQWWWEFRYVSDRPDRSFTTANELHLPVGKPVRVELTTSDVIHSFWIPALAGKTDTIAGQRNITWIEASEPGVYRGQCTEYCGLQHAHMGLIAVAEPPDQFEAWWSRQLEGPRLPDREPQLDQALQGQNAFMRNCAVCHTVRGTNAGGRVGPDLSHLMDRRTIASATLPNTAAYRSGWLADPQHLKPGNYMPTLTLSAAELEQINTFLTALK
jgi:cytochrome c oxidase subunit 2